jgi:hypothetical protein
MFFSVPNKKQLETILDLGAQNILVSHHYIKKSVQMQDVIKRFVDKGGTFMLDSGGATYLDYYINNYSTLPDEMFTEAYWTPFVDSYVEFIYKFKDYIYSAVNFDMDYYLGHDKIMEYNDGIFKELDNYVNIIYIAHFDPHKKLGRATYLLKRIKLYMDKYDYIGISGNRTALANAEKIYRLAKMRNKRLHGFAWTSVPTLKKYPFFTIDSSTWSLGTRIGVTFNCDGKNMRRYEMHEKHKRKATKIRYRGVIDNDLLQQDEYWEVHRNNIHSWRLFEEYYYRIANFKLWNQPINCYDKRK